MQPQSNIMRPRTKIIAGIMLVIFAVSVAVAWWLSAHRQSFIRAGEEIMTQIHQEGLKSHYGRGVQQYFITREKGANMGWLIVESKPVADGYKGLNVQYSAKFDSTSWESWQLDNDLSTGRYNAQEPSIRFADVQARTQILLERRRVEVTQAYLSPSGQEVSELSQTSTAAVPTNYLAEGSLQLAIRKVAQSHTNAYFKIMINQVEPIRTNSGLEARLSTAHIEYAGQESVSVGDKTVQASVVSLTRSGFGQEMTSKYYFAPDYSLVMILDGDSTIVRVTRPELDSAYPRAYEYFSRVAASSDADYGKTSARAGIVENTASTSQATQSQPLSGRRL